MAGDDMTVRRYVTALWLAWRQKQPWVAVPIPLMPTDYRQFDGVLWLPIEAAVFGPELDAAVGEGL